jgi:hypothetical protein
MVESLIDRAVESNVEETQPETDSDTISDLKVNNNNIYLQTLLDDSWSKLISLDSLVYAD